MLTLRTHDMVFAGINGKLASENFFGKWISRGRRKWWNDCSKLSLIAIELNFLLLSLRIKSLLNCCYSIALRTIHRVNGIVIQSGKCSETTYSNYEPKNKRSRRSFQLPSQLNEEVSYKKTIGPEQLHCPDSFLCLEFKRNMLIMDFISKRKYKLCCSNWTGFNVLKRNEMPILSGNMQYLTSIKPPTREMNTIVTVLDCCLKIKEQLRLN